MGQINLPVLNKTGYSVFWDSCFDNTFNFSKDLHASIFTKKIIKLFFKDKSSRLFVFLKVKKLKKILNEFLLSGNQASGRSMDFYFTKLSTFDDIKKKALYWYKYKSVPYYGTKIFFIKYDNWVIITFRV